MKKRVTKVVKMELPGGNAHPGPKLASAGVNMAKFCTDFNAKTGDRKGDIVPVIITAYEDKSYDFVIKPPRDASRFSFAPLIRPPVLPLFRTPALPAALPLILRRLSPAAGISEPTYDKTSVFSAEPLRDSWLPA